MYQGNYLAQHLAAASIDRGERIFAHLENGTDLSYADFFNGAQQYANLLIALGVTPNDRVAVQVDKCIEVLQLYIGTVLAGGVFLPLNTAYTPSEISYFLEDAQPRVFICADASAQLLKPVADAAAVNVLETLNADGSGSFATLAQIQAVAFEAVPRSADDLAAILYTSGTTGRSKGAMLSHRNLWSNSSTLRDTWHFTPQDKLIHALPIFHTHGLFVAINVTLATGSSLIFMQGFNIDDIITAMPKATVLMGVPTFYVRLLKHTQIEADFVKKMRLFISGSAPLLAETHQSWSKATGHDILERYGMTETNMNTSNPYHAQRCPGTVGLPLPGVEVRVCDAQTQQLLAPNSIGSIEVRGPNVFSGYWNMPDKTKQELRDNGFFITGDLGIIDDKGYISIIGRSKDLIITGGYNVYPKEIEILIDDIAGVLESAVIGLAHADFGESVCAVIVRQGDNAISADDIKHTLSGHLAKYKQPKQIFFVDELPRNAMGKVQKNSLRESFDKQ
ncbi:MAG: malonyl-CoA synthase [Oceanospirillaceae bacterium]|nr:malonyl-CoA synthase [Oceanospirillaceae bacterium]